MTDCTKYKLCGGCVNRIHVGPSQLCKNFSDCQYLNIQRADYQLYTQVHGQLIAITITSIDNTKTQSCTDSSSLNIYFPSNIYTIFIVKLPGRKAYCGCDIYVAVNVTNEHLASDITVRTWDFKISKKSNKCHFKLQFASRLLQTPLVQINYNLDQRDHINFQWFTDKEHPSQCVDANKLSKMSHTSLIFSSSIQLSTLTNDIVDDVPNKISSTGINIDSFSPEGSQTGTPTG